MSDIVHISYAEFNLFNLIYEWISTTATNCKTNIRLICQEYNIKYDDSNVCYILPSELLTLIILNSSNV